jgi:hypothetical protein
VGTVIVDPVYDLSEPTVSRKSSMYPFIEADDPLFCAPIWIVPIE